MSCIHCGKNPYILSEAKEEAPKAKDITFTSDGQTLTAKAKRYDDAFYEIVVGKYKGNLVHVWDIVKS